ncbi:hypothetical protein AZE42_03665 [Rhizopogon vesiculosus]|uniref:Uncharacterized protein n=1 Tax=Rhizopogon vesiculosus TaxID=180088 RepID=A0A1J8QD15_9AGAM|nr:hypothetical protein AZE42_03665 [Rhizopogon vesiculosus]
MATKSKSDTDAPPSYDAIQSKCQSSGPVFSRILRQKSTSNTILSCIRDLVTGPNFNPSSVDPIINSCASALSAAKFSSLLQSRNIDGHSAIYWAIVNNRLEAVSASTKFISKLSSGCRSDLRRACMVTSNHTLFTQLNLGRNVGPDDRPLRRSLGYSPDEIEVHEGDQAKNQFVALFRFRMCQRRLHITQNITSAEFVAGGRIWWTRIHMGPEGRWRMTWGLSQHSLPARPNAVVLIKAHMGKPGCATPPQELRLVSTRTNSSLVPKE